MKTSDLILTFVIGMMILLGVILLSSCAGQISFLPDGSIIYDADPVILIPHDGK